MTDGFWVLAESAARDRNAKRDLAEHGRWDDLSTVAERETTYRRGYRDGYVAALDHVWDVIPTNTAYRRVYAWLWRWAMGGRLFEWYRSSIRNTGDPAAHREIPPTAPRRDPTPTETEA